MDRMKTRSQRRRLGIHWEAARKRKRKLLVKSPEQLLLDAVDRDFEGFDRSIDVHIAANWGTTHPDAGA
jgi:hypothetical protein